MSRFAANEPSTLEHLGNRVELALQARARDDEATAAGLGGHVDLDHGDEDLPIEVNVRHARTGRFALQPDTAMERVDAERMQGHPATIRPNITVGNM